MREHVKNRANAKKKIRKAQSNTADLFPGHEAEVQEATLDEIVDEQKALASADLMAALPLSGPLYFSTIVVGLQAYMLRETNIKDICVNLAKAGKIENTWGVGNRKPRNEDMIKLKAHARQVET